MSRGFWSAALLLGALSAAAIGASRARVTPVVEAVQQRSDVYPLPPADMLVGASMGYRAALADLLWAHVLVTQGLRMVERRPFEHVAQYLDAINALDPKFREPYRFADSLLLIQAGSPDTDRNAHVAREILERGLRERPYDAQLWLNYGHFLAYLAGGALRDPIERSAWRRDGARAMVRAVELGGHDAEMVIRSIGAARILYNEGADSDAIRFLDWAYSATDDPQIRADLEQRRRMLAKGSAESRMLKVTRAFEKLWQNDLPFVSRSQMSVLGPPVEVWQCAGPSESRHREANCARQWGAWLDVVLRRPEGT